MNNAKKIVCLISIVAILGTNSVISFAQSENVSVSAETNAELFASVDGITFERDYKSETTNTRVVKVKYSKDYFTSGISRFNINLNIPSSNVSDVVCTSNLKKFDNFNSNYSGNTFTCYGSASAEEKPGGDVLFTITMTVKAENESDFSVSLASGTSIGDTIINQSIDNGGLNSAVISGFEGGTGEWIGQTTGASGGVSWSYSGHILTLSGTGNMQDYSLDNLPPWYEETVNRNQIKSVVFVGDGVKSIGAYAFYDLPNLKTLVISESINTIGNHSFENCKSLEDIRFPISSYAVIGENAFKNCTSLNDVVITENVTGIAQGAFEGCSNIKSIVLPFIGPQPGDKENVETFSYIFNGSVPSSIKTVNITNEKSVPDKAFEGCSSISSITINDGIKAIGAEAFKDCRSLTSFNIPQGITEINNATFQNCSSITSITVPDTVMSIGEAAFDGCGKLTSIHIPDAVSEIADYTFRNCSSLTDIQIPDGVASIGVDVLKGCNRIKTMKIPFVGAKADPKPNIISEEGVFGYLFGKSEYGVQQGDYTYGIPASVTKVEVANKDTYRTYIATGAFINCANIVDIIIDGGTRICDDAFKNCKALKNLYLPESVDGIGTEILVNCTNIQTLTVPFIGKNRDDNNTETSVLGYFFGWSDEFTSGADVEQVYNKNGDSHYYHIPEKLKNVSVINNTTISYGVFSQCKNLEHIAIKSGPVLAEKAFYNCKSLNDVSLPVDLMEIGEQCFAECSKLETINIPVGTDYIGDYAFYNVRNLKEITIPDSVAGIAKRAFAGTGAMSTASLASADDDAVLFDGGNMIVKCVKGSAADEYFADNANVTLIYVSPEQLDINKTSSTIEEQSDGKFMADVVHTNVDVENASLFVGLYGVDGSLITFKTKDIVKDNMESRIFFEGSEIAAANEVRIFIWDSLNGMKPITNEVESITLH